MILKFEDPFFNDAKFPRFEYLDTDKISRVRIYSNKIKFNLVGVFGRVWVYRTERNMRELTRFLGEVYTELK